MTPLEEFQAGLKVGDYAMHHMNGGVEGTVVRLCQLTKDDRFGIEYLGREGQGGGSSYAWPRCEFRPLTGVRELLVSRIFEQDRLRRWHSSAADVARIEEQAHRLALRAFDEAAKVAADLRAACGAP